MIIDIKALLKEYDGNKRLAVGYIRQLFDRGFITRAERLFFCKAIINA